MKKVVAVLIALSLMVSLASAGYVQIRAVGNTSDTVTASYGDTLTIQVSVSGFSDQVLDSLALINFDVTEQLTGGAASGEASSLTIAPDLFDNSFAGMAGMMNKLVWNVLASRGETANANDPGWAVAETVIYSFDYTIGESDSGEIFLGIAENYSPSWGNIAGDALSEGVTDSGLTVKVVPEPITLALLGLGGLFIRRRQ